MTSIALKTLNFDHDANKQDAKAKEFKLPVSLDSESPKSVAYIVRWQLAARRAGTAKVKTMAEISGTTAKPHKQKGTGRARQGSKRSVQFVGGRTCHGPVPRSFDFSMPKKIVKIALSDALKAKLKDNKVMLFSDVASDKIKTSKINSILAVSKISSALILFDGSSKNSVTLAKSAQNIKHVKALDVKAVNVYDLLKFDQLIVESKVFENSILGVLQ